MAPPDDDPRLPSAAAAWTSAFSMVWRAWPLGALTTLVVTPALSGVTILRGFALKGVVDGFGGDRAWLFLALLLVSFVAVPLLGGLSGYADVIHRDRFQHLFANTMLDLAVRPHGIEHLESPRFRDRHAHASGGTWTITHVFGLVSRTAGNAIAAVVATVVLARLHLLLVVPVAAAALTGVLSTKARQRSLRAVAETTAEGRLAEALSNLAASPGAAKDLRIFGLREWLVTRHRVTVESVTRQVIRAQRGPVYVAAFGGTAQALLLGSGLALLLQLTASGGVTAGDIALGVTLLQGAIAQVSSLGASGANLTAITHYARTLLELQRYEPQVRTPAVPAPVRDRLRDGIRLEDLTFRYPETDSFVLSDVSLHFPAGSTVALVGDNGAGKTTIVKLLLRLYDPTSGRVTVDGLDLRDFDPEMWRSRTTGAFQDFMKFEFLARETIGVGSLALLDDSQAIRAAAAAGGSAPLIESLPDRYESQLGRTFPEGTDLSEGQWQKVAVSRGMMRSEPLLVLLDEPTAALDARAEHELFERYAAMASGARQRGAVTLLVSHRFSTVQMADHIVVLDGGRVSEQGSHSELLAAGGKYAEMYEMQAARYR